MEHYFAFYGLPVRFYLDEKLLKKLFLETSRKFHPDYFTMASENEKADALIQSSYNNDAYKILSDEHSRLKYILDLKNILKEEGKNAIPQEFLMEMMELNEKVMELQFEFDTSVYEACQSELAGLKQSIFSEVEEVMKSYTEDMEDAVLEPVKNYYLKQQYLKRLEKNLSQIQK